MEQNPLAKYELKRFGAAGKSRNQEGVFTNQSGNAARDARRAARRDQRPATFAEMQQEGVARPAPAPMSLFTGQQANVVEGEGATPTPPPGPEGYDGPTYSPPTPPPSQPPAPSPTSAYDARRAAALANIRAQFSGQRQALEEDLARRGLAASSFGSGRLGDLEGQQSRALASLEADLLGEERNQDLDYLKMLINLATQFGVPIGG
jgi:hypothetical protein